MNTKHLSNLLNSIHDYADLAKGQPTRATMDQIMDFADQAAAELEKLKNAPVFIHEHEEGSTVTDEDGNEFPYIITLDWESLAVSNECPICHTEIRNDDERCPECGFDCSQEGDGGHDEDLRAIEAAVKWSKRNG